MDDTFELDVEFNGEQYEFEGKLIVTGYGHKIELNVLDTKVLFEPDEERSYRALLSMKDLQETRLNVDLLKTIAQRLDSLLK